MPGYRVGVVPVPALDTVTAGGREEQRLDSAFKGSASREPTTSPPKTSRVQ